MSESSDIVDVIVDAFDEILGINEENSNEIDKIVTKSEEDLKQCEEVIRNISFMNDCIQKDILPTVDKSMDEIQRMFSAVDVMEKTIIPSLFADLDVIDTIVDNIDRKIAKQNQRTSALRSLWNKVGFSSSSRKDSNDISSTGQIKRNDDFVPSDFPVHDQGLILHEIVNSIPTSASSIEDS